MLNGRNWWTKPKVTFEYNEDLKDRIRNASELVWNEKNITSIEEFIDAVEIVIDIVNRPKKSHV